jgi:hypothetical protein
MKKISQIFKNNRSLIEEPEVSELIDYCNDLESEIIDLRYDLKNNKEETFRSILHDIDISLKEIIKLETNPSRFDKEIDYKSLIGNLNNYLEDAKKIYSIRF